MRKESRREECRLWEFSGSLWEFNGSAGVKRLLDFYGVARFRIPLLEEEQGSLLGGRRREESKTGKVAAVLELSAGKT